MLTLEMQYARTHKCKCGTVVTAGVNGDVWEADSTEPGAYCYKCENDALEAAEKQLWANAVDAAIRAGRSDLV